ncbi:MAG: NAD+ synthase [Neisseria sp.]|nr:NAD+ synthase [Neisseria sp.]
MRTALLQMNPVVGDCARNAATIVAAAEEAKRCGASLLLTPEMSLTGSPTEDLLLRPGFLPPVDATLAQIAAVRGITVVVGFPEHDGRHYFNAAGVWRDGERIAVYRKNTISPQQEWNEARYFTAGERACVFAHEGVKYGVLFDADLGNVAAVAQARADGAQALLVLAASPFYAGKHDERLAAARAAQHGLPLLYVNAAGGQDAWVFDGASFALDAQGRRTFQAAFCEEGLSWVDAAAGQQSFSGSLNVLPEATAQLYHAVLCGLRDYVRKCGFSRLCLGLSGGLDSALVLALAVDAVGAEHCEVLLMPSQYTAELSNTAAVKMAENLGVRYESVPISDVFGAFKSALANRFSGLAEDVTEENLQARIRGTLLMALSNKSGALLLSTGNKSEVAMGYSTLYGDMNGGFAPLKDLYKTEVYAISRWLNATRGREIIPQEIIDRPPSAELRANQTDQDSLPEYAVLDEMLRLLMDENLSAQALIERGFAAAEVARTVKLLRLAEYKRQQGAIGPKVSRCAFDVDWRQPICQRFGHD